MALLTYTMSLSLVGGSFLLSRCFSVKSLYLNLRWFKCEVASPYRRPINLKQTVNVSLLMTVKSVARFYSPKRSSLCFFSVVNPPFLPMPCRLLVESHPVTAYMAGKRLHASEDTFSSASCTGINLLFLSVPV